MKSKEKVKKNKVDKKSRVTADIKDITKKLKKTELVYRSIKDLKPYKNNPRKITEEAIEKVKNSIKRFGIKVPLVIDNKNVIVCGHTRLKAISMLKIEDEADNKTTLDYNNIPCILASDLSDAEIKAFRIADNKTAEFSLWDEKLLGIEMESIEDEIDLSDFGFDDISDDVDLNEQAEVDLDKVKPKKKVTCPKCGFEFEVE